MIDTLKFLSQYKLIRYIERLVRKNPDKVLGIIAKAYFKQVKGLK